MIKPKVEPPPLAPKQEANKQRQLVVNADVDARLNKFIEANPDLMNSYRELVKQEPERAARKLALNKMFKHEEVMELVKIEMPQVNAWVDQNPGMRERIAERIKDVNPYYRERAFVREARWQKNRLDFRPPSTAATTGVKASVG